MVGIPKPWGGKDEKGSDRDALGPIGNGEEETTCASGECVPAKERPRRTKKEAQLQPTTTGRKRVKERWFYQPVLGTETALKATAQPRNEGIKGVSDAEVGGKEQNHDRFDILEILEDNHKPKP